MFNGDENLRHSKETYEYSENELLEILKSSEDIEYFAENYCHIVSLSEGKILISLWDFQREMLRYLVDTPSYDKFNDGKIRNNNIIFTPRQVGKSTIIVIYALWIALFNKNKTIYLLSNNLAGALDLMERLTLIYQMLPEFMQIGLTELNKKTITFGNGSTIKSRATTPSAIRGRSVNCVVCDEFAFIPDNLANEFKKSVFPTIISAKNPLDTKIVLISTANKLNHFYHSLQKARQGKSDFIPFEVAWNDHPDRDEKFREKIIESEGIEYWEQEFACLGPDSLIEILNTETQEVFKITVEDFYHFVQY